MRVKGGGDGLRVVHCPTMVGGNPQGLSSAEREIGLNSRSLVLSHTYLNYKTDKIIYRQGAGLLENELRRWSAIFDVLRSSDVIHYNFGETLAPTRLMNPTGRYPAWKVWLYNNLYAKWFEFSDMKIARRLGKVITVTYQGDDARQGDYCQKNYQIHFCSEVNQSYYSKKTDAEKRRRILIFDQYAHFIYAVNPDLLHVLPKRTRFVPYASVDPRVWKSGDCHGVLNDQLHIVHAPSHRGVKGTKYINSAIERLKNEGYDFRYTMVEGQSNVDARKIYETADILIDQVLAGFYGALAVELMALGKPVICYLREEDMHFLPPGMRDDMPIINARPDNIYDVLKEMLTDRKHELQSIGVRSRAYVEKWHDPIKIAAEITQDYQRVYAEKHCGKRAD